MKVILTLFAVLHGLIALLFVAAALVLMAIAARMSWLASMNGMGVEAAQGLIEAVGLAAVAVVSLQIAQTIAEEEVVRMAHVSAPTRVRRFLSRFLVVVVVALSIEGLIATFKALHEDFEMLPHAASILVGVGIVLAGWGWFIACNRRAEELEPEAMEEAKSEDRKLEQ